MTDNTDLTTEPGDLVQSQRIDDDGVSHGINLPCSLGRDQEAREGLIRELLIADVDTTTEPRRVAIDYADNGGTRPAVTELGWFDVRPMLRQLVEFSPDLVVMRREDLPEFHGAQLAEAQTTIAAQAEEIRALRARVDELTTACQRKNGDCETYARERRQAIEAKTTAENDAADLRARWAAYATALSRLDGGSTLPQVVGKNIVMRHETWVDMEKQRDELADSWVTADQHESTVNRLTAETQSLSQKVAQGEHNASALRTKLDLAEKEHEETRAELRAITEHARKWESIATIIDLMRDSNQAELIIDGVRITPVDGRRTRSTTDTTTGK